MLAVKLSTYRDRLRTGTPELPTGTVGSPRDEDTTGDNEPLTSS